MHETNLSLGVWMQYCASTVPQKHVFATRFEMQGAAMKEE
jgi:hypothetical protein